MARPRKTLPEGGIALIRRLASNGVQETVIATALGLDFKTWKRIRTDDPEANAAWEEARSAEEDKLVGVLYQQAVGVPHKVDDEGKVVSWRVQPVPSAAMFLLKARHGYRDMGAADAAIEGRVNIQINLPAALEPDQFKKLVEVHPKAVAEAEEGQAA